MSQSFLIPLDWGSHRGCKARADGGDFSMCLLGVGLLESAAQSGW